MVKRKASDLSHLESIDQQAASTSGTGPFVVYFPSGFDPNAGDGRVEWQVYAHQQRKRQYELVARTDHNVDFVGSTLAPDYSSAPACRQALAHFDRSTGCLEVMPVEAGAVMRMEPRAHSLEYGAATTATGVGDTEKRDHTMRLVEEFGSQRRRRQLVARREGAVQASAVSAGATVMGMIAQQGRDMLSKEEVIAQSLAAARNVPPHHPEATAAGEAYRLVEVVPPTVLAALESHRLAQAAHSAEFRHALAESGQFGSGYVLSRVAEAVRSAPEVGVQESRCASLALAGHLLKLYGKRGVLSARGGVEELAESNHMAPGVLEGVLALFYNREEEEGREGVKYLLTKQRRDLMLSYILVLALMAEQASVLEPDAFCGLAAELRVRPNELAERFRELGCMTFPTTILEGGTRIRTFKVSLLPPAAEGKTLAQCFPPPKLGGKKGGSR